MRAFRWGRDGRGMARTYGGRGSIWHPRRKQGCRAAHWRGAEEEAAILVETRRQGIVEEAAKQRGCYGVVLENVCASDVERYQSKWLSWCSTGGTENACEL